MTSSQSANPAPRRPLRLRGGVVGIGAAACAVCCAAPLMALVGIGLTGAAATALTAAFAGLVFTLVVAVATVAAVVVRRGRARGASCAGVPPGPVTVEFGRRPDRPERAAP